MNRGMNDERGKVGKVGKAVGKVEIQNKRIAKYPGGVRKRSENRKNTTAREKRKVKKLCGGKIVENKKISGRVYELGKQTSKNRK